MKPLAKKELKSEKNPDKKVLISVTISDGFEVREDITKNVKKELNVLAEYVLNKMKEEDPWP